MAFRFEFDRANRILLAGFEGRVTEGLVAECYRATRKYSTTTDARAQILDFSYTIEFALSSDFLQALARKPALPDGLMRPCFIVAPTAFGFGLARVFQMEGERTRPLLEVVHTIDEALAALGVQSTHFERLDLAGRPEDSPLK
jgi:hypothetical protein